MINIKKVGLEERVLLLALFFLVSFAGRAEAIDLNLPVSIHEILSPEQIKKVKADSSLRAVQQGMRRQAMTEQVGPNAGAIMQKMMGMRLGGVVNSKFSAQVKKKTAQKMEKLDSEVTVQADPTP